MPRLNFEISEEDRRYLKSRAASEGLSIKDYIKKRLMPSREDQITIHEAEQAGLGKMTLLLFYILGPNVHEKIAGEPPADDNRLIYRMLDQLEEKGLLKKIRHMDYETTPKGKKVADLLYDGLGPQFDPPMSTDLHHMARMLSAANDSN